MKAEMPLLLREGAVRPKSFNEEERTVEMVWTAGAKVRRRDWEQGEFDEELVVSEETIDMSRLGSGAAPLLEAHNTFELRNVIGVVEEAWIARGRHGMEGRARVRFSKRADVDPILQDVRDGIIRNVSVGYRVSEWQRKDRKDDVPLMRATRWEPHELSLVPIGADGAAQVRTHQGDLTFPCIIRAEGESSHLEETTMAKSAEKGASVDDTEAPEKNAPAIDPANPDPVPTEPGPTPGPNPKPVPPAPPLIAPTAPGPIQEQDKDEDEEKAERALARGMELERRRISAIDTACRFYRFPDAERQKLISGNVSVEDAQRSILDWAHKQQEPTQVTSIHYGVSRDEGETRGQALTESLLHRTNPQQHKMTDLVRENGYQRLKLVQIAEECLSFAGVKHRGMSDFQIIDLALKPAQVRMGGMHTTSDFANILSSVIYTNLRAAYDRQEPTFAAWARRATVPDFRDVSRVALFGPTGLARVNEHGEIPRGTLTESAESYRIATFGEIIGVTRQMLVNDQLGAFSRLPEMLAAMARQLESDIVYSVLLQNAAMGDGTALFHANHSNLASPGAAIGATTVSDAYVAMSTQTEPTSGSVLNISPSYLLVPPGARQAAEAFVNGQFNPAVLTDVVPAYLRNLQVISEARLATGVTLKNPLGNTAIAGDLNAWYLLSAPGGMVETVEYAYLEGQEGIRTDTRTGFEVEGMEVKAVMDFGAKALDWRGMYKNAGGA
jgi:hypothetical protein